MNHPVQSWPYLCHAILTGQRSTAWQVMIVLNDEGKLEIISLKLMDGKDLFEAATLLVWSRSVLFV